MASIIKAIADVFSVPQSDEERDEDYEQIANSIISLVICGILMFLGWIAVSLARGRVNLVKIIKIRLRTSTPKITTKPQPVAPGTEPAPPELAPPETEPKPPEAELEVDSKVGRTRHVATIGN